MPNVLDYLEHAAHTWPDHTAFSDPDCALSFAGLHAAAQRAGSFVAARLAPRSPVVFFCEKSTRVAAGFLGAVYAGCFYTLIDPGLPAARQKAILQKLEARLILTTPQHRQQAQALDSGCAIHLLEDALAAPLLPKTLSEIRSQALDIDPLYANFTSGSTGTPKGVVVSHRSVLDFIPLFTGLFGITRQDVLANQAPFDFDVSVKDFYSGLFCGATVHLIPRSYFSQPVLLMDYLDDNRVTTLIWAVSALCFVTTMNGLAYRTPASVNKILFSGEVMPLRHLEKWQQYLPKATYVNLYGPTEITCNCTYHILKPGPLQDIPIGRPFPNERVFLLDEENQLITQPHQTGEICVSGTALSLGYYNDPEQTAQAFVQNPTHHRYLETIYRTGDLGRYDEGGLLHYLSRKDFQIKFQGHRIELGEIELALQSLDGMDRACCQYLQDRQKILAFYTGTLSKAEIATALKPLLPPYMHPHIYVPVDAMPLTKNGKIDRAALLALYQAK